MRLLVVWKDLDDADLTLIKKKTGATVLKGFTKEEALKWAPDADVILGWASSEVLAEAVKCRWLQAPYAGAERILAARWGNPEMVFTNGRGIFGSNIAEHVLGFILSFNRGLHLARDHQNQRIWEPRLPIPFRELTGATVGILGFGDIGRQVARRLQGFDCRVLAFRQHPQGEEEYAEAVYGMDRFEGFLAEFDYLVCSVPETPKTIGFLNRNLLQRLPAHCLVVNVGRGSLIPGEDLLLALQEGWIAGAALDVTDPEPLPVDHPLWTMPNVIITPHNSGLTVFHKERALNIFFENWHHFVAEGSPKINVVNRSLGY
ncbi:MAG: D-2-hydroxyacid dehydrogenase [Firmicutes bacterium]|nr:D-2-hydroxyacid dehydrogenase [Bacillota bacterium]